MSKTFSTDDVVDLARRDPFFRPAAAKQLVSHVTPQSGEPLPKPTSLSGYFPWPPTVNTYYRHVGHKTLISKRGREYRKAVVAQLTGAVPMQGRLQIVVFTFPPDLRTRDLDNLTKGLFDSLKHGKAIKDDSQFKRIVLEERELYRPEGRVWVEITPLPEAHRGG
jgi:crossover junction endodeoxyribonuclease RusA